jgi:hypothetical protein
MLFEMVCYASYLHGTLTAPQVRREIPYMARFDEDWATTKIASGYAKHLRSSARKKHQLPADPRYGYLKANSAKRRPDAPRGARPSFSKGQDQTAAGSNGGQDAGPSGARPSSFPDVNTAADEDVMNAPGLFGFNNPSDDENESDLDEDPDFEGRK